MFYERLKELAIREQALFEEKIMANDGEDNNEEDDEFTLMLDLLGEKEPLI